MSTPTRLMAQRGGLGNGIGVAHTHANANANGNVRRPVITRISSDSFQSTPLQQESHQPVQPQPRSQPHQPLTADLFYHAACRAQDARDLSAALHLFTAALELDSKHVPSLIGRGVARKESKDYERAIEDYTRALQLSPNDSTALLILSNRANCLTSAGSFAAALTDHNSAISLNKHDAVLWCNRGCTLMKLGRLDDALGDFQRSIDVDKNYPIAHYNSGIVHARSGHHNLAIRAFERAADLFRRSTANSSSKHALDCERQIALLNTGSHACNTAVRTLPMSNSSPPTDILSPTSPSHRYRPHSPVHKRGMSRNNPGYVPSTTPSQDASPIPDGTPVSRSHLNDQPSLTPPSDRLGHEVVAIASPSSPYQTGKAYNQRLTTTITPASPSAASLSYYQPHSAPSNSPPQPYSTRFQSTDGHTNGSMAAPLSPLSEKSPLSTGSTMSDEPLLISPTAKRFVPTVTRAHTLLQPSSLDDANAYSTTVSSSSVGSHSVEKGSHMLRRHSSRSMSSNSP